MSAMSASRSFMRFAATDKLGSMLAFAAPEMNGSNGPIPALGRAGFRHLRTSGSGTFPTLQVLAKRVSFGERGGHFPAWLGDPINMVFALYANFPSNKVWTIMKFVLGSCSSL